MEAAKLTCVSQFANLFEGLGRSDRLMRNLDFDRHYADPILQDFFLDSDADRALREHISRLVQVVVPAGYPNADQIIFQAGDLEFNNRTRRTLNPLLRLRFRPSLDDRSKVRFLLFVALRSMEGLQRTAPTMRGITFEALVASRWRLPRRLALVEYLLRTFAKNSLGAGLSSDPKTYNVLEKLLNGVGGGEDAKDAKKEFDESLSSDSVKQGEAEAMMVANSTVVEHILGPRVIVRPEPDAVVRAPEGDFA